MRYGAAGQAEKLQAVVEFGAVTAILVDYGEEFGEVIPKKLRLQHGLARVHPVLVAPQSVDLAVVDQVAVGVRPIPARESIRAEPRVDEGQSGLHMRIGEVRIELL